MKIIWDIFEAGFFLGHPINDDDTVT